MVLPAEHLHLQIVAYLVNQLYLYERLATNEIPHNTRLSHILLVTEDVVNILPCYLVVHSLFRILPYEVAVFAGELAVLRDNERDGFLHSQFSEVAFLTQNGNNVLITP